MLLPALQSKHTFWHLLLLLLLLLLLAPIC
jgi:hypothetical protein